MDSTCLEDTKKMPLELGGASAAGYIVCFLRAVRLIIIRVRMVIQKWSTPPC
jgi:hypothetical protein